MPNFASRHHRRIPPEETDRDEKRLYQQHDPRVQDSHIDHLTGRPDAQRQRRAQESGNARSHIDRDQRRDQATEISGRESPADVDV